MQNVAGPNAKAAAQRVIATVRVGNGSSALAVEGSTEFATSPQTGDAYVPDIVFCVVGHDEYSAVVGVSAISAQTGKITSTIRLPRAVGNGDWGSLTDPFNQLAVSPVTGDVYTLNPVNAQTANPMPEYEVSVISS